jgi:hypothetical protein
MKIVGALGRVSLASFSLMLGSVLFVAAVGCGDKDDDVMRGEPDAGPPVFDAGSDDERNEVEPGELCERVATVQCAAEAYCCSNPGRTFDQCKTIALDACEDDLQLDLVAMEDVAGFDAAKTTAVFDQFEAYAKDCDPAITVWGASVNGIRAMVQGTRDEGDNCAPRNNSNSAVLAGAGLVSCSDPETTACQPRGVPKGGVLDWTCDERSDVDGECFSDLNCKDGLYCENPEGRLLQTCKTIKELGDACTFAHECASYNCEDGECAEIDVQVAYCLKFE